LIEYISILGSTGSIGTQTLEVAESLGIKIVGLAALKNVSLMEEQARRFKPEYVALHDEEKAKELKLRLADTSVKVDGGLEGVCRVAALEKSHRVVAGIVGIDGLLPTVSAIEAGKDICLANKETLVTAGDMIIPWAKQRNISILPVDSEHSAIFQSMESGKPKEVKRIILTASGGAFLGKKKSELENVTVSQALAHPNWDMGSKITVDSATLMNKGFEVIEAMFLFGTNPENIQTVIHPQSIIHSAVEFTDGSAETIEKCITERTRAVLVVHKTGIICDMDPILRLAEKHRLIVYEDVCQAVFGKYKGRLAGTFGKAAAFSFDAEKTLGSDTGGCIITNDDEIADRARYMGHSRDAKTVPGFGRVHQDQGLAYRMPSCTAAMTLAQLEIIKPAVEKIDRMARYLTSLIRNIDGILPLEIPDYVDLYSCWMFGFRIDPEKFLCTPEEFVKRLADEGIGDAGLGKYYLMPESLKFLQRKAEKKIYPFSKPPASFDYVYDENTCPNAHRFLKTFIRWSSFSEKYEKEHCELAASIIEKVARANRK
jgi:dTDP-4-amino-4,6-dideoxygalactose transaminase